MDTCVRNAYYEEALELSSFVKRLDKKFATIKIITVSSYLKVNFLEETFSESISAWVTTLLGVFEGDTGYGYVKVSFLGPTSIGCY